MIRYLSRLLCLSLLCLCMDASAQQVSIPNLEDICAVKLGKPGRWSVCQQYEVGRPIIDTVAQELVAVVPDTQWVRLRVTPYKIVDRSKCKTKTTDAVMIEYKACR